MNYSEMTELAQSKNIMIKTLCENIGYTRAGLRTALNNETIELRKLKLLCETLRISPAQFFDSGTFGVIMTGNNGHAQIGNNNKMKLENQASEIEYLKQQVKDKEEIIRLLKFKINNNQGYGNVAEL